MLRKNQIKFASVLLLLSMILAFLQPESALAQRNAICSIDTAVKKEECKEPYGAEQKGLSWSDIWNFLIDTGTEEETESKKPNAQYAKVKIKVAEQYKQAFAVLKIVNAERKKKGLGSLKMDQTLLEASMLRAAEISLYFGHTRPNGTDCFTASDLIYAENIAAGQEDAVSVMRAWMNSPGHRANILSASRKSIGIGCIELDGIKYWVQNFGNTVSVQAKPSEYKNKKRSQTIQVSASKTYYRPKITLSSKRIHAGETISVKTTWYNGFVTVPISSGSLKYKSLKKSVCTVSKGKIKGRSAGTAKIKIYFPGYEKGAVSKKITVK